MQKNTISDRQLAANRANAQKSTGPRTPEGKNITRMNGITHGITTKIFVLSTEDQKEFDTLRDSFRERFRPQDPFESDLVDQIVTVRWHIGRIRDIEDVQLEIGIHRPGLLDAVKATSDHLRLAVAYSNLATQSGGGCLGLANRQLSRLSREYHRLVRMLLDLRKSCPPAEPSVGEKQAGQTEPIPISGHHQPPVDPSGETTPSAPPLPTDHRPPAAPPVDTPPTATLRYSSSNPIGLIADLTPSKL